MVELFSKLEDILSREKIKNCFVDTSVLFSVTYPSDSFNDLTVAAFDCLSDFRISAFTNVNVRSEFLEGHRRVLIAECLIDFLEEMESALDGVLLEKLRTHKKTYRLKIKEEKSTKMELSQIKVFRKLLTALKTPTENGWEKFCHDFLHDKLTPIWSETEKDLNLNFIILRSQDYSPYLNKNPQWEGAVEIMGRYGISSADAMIVNMFLCSKIPLLLTADLEMAECVSKESQGQKRVYVPDNFFKF